MKVHQDSARRLLDYRDAAAMLKVSTGAIRAWSRTGRLRSIKLGKSVRFDPRDLEALIERGSLDTRTQRARS